MFRLAKRQKRDKLNWNVYSFFGTLTAPIQFCLGKLLFLLFFFLQLSLKCFNHKMIRGETRWRLFVCVCKSPDKPSATIKDIKWNWWLREKKDSNLLLVVSCWCCCRSCGIRKERDLLLLVVDPLLLPLLHTSIVNKKTIKGNIWIDIIFHKSQLYNY
jgi:hypothetical protein